MAATSEEHGISGSKTLFVRNLPYSSTNDSLEKVFSDIGPIKECFVVNDKATGKCRGFGYVKFSLFDDAERALKTVEKIDGRPVHLMYANKKEKKKRQPRAPPNARKQFNNNDDEVEDVKPDVTEIKDEPGIRKDNNRTGFTRRPKGERVKPDPKSRVEGKRARLIVRNLSFWCTEDQLREAFSKYGKIVEVHIPTKEDGRKFGFGFVQFSNKAEAGMAVKYHSGKKINDRPVAVDFTLPKVMYEQKVSAQAPVEPESESEDEQMDVDEMETTVKEESDTEIKEEDISEEDEKEDQENSEKEEEESEGGDDDDDEEEEEESDEDSGSDDEYPSKSNKKIDRPTDVNQGKTVFIRNLPFDAEEEDIESHFSQFGKILYTRCVVDHATGMSKGSAFIKFSTKETAEKCLKGSEEGGQHSYGGRELYVSLALDRDTAQGLKSDKKKQPKDSRNLYLAREGMIRPGTLAAKDVPAPDLAKRLKNDELKRKKLKNQNTFISSTRLCLHNIPATVTANALRGVIKKHVECKKSELKEVKIMWDMKRVNSQGKPKSKGFGFVGFSTHEMALDALRKLNNNPDIFGPTKRPIVEFAIENRRALQLKEKRLEKSKMRANEEKEKRAMQGRLKKKGLKGKATSASMERANQDKIARSMHSGPIGLPRHSGPKQRHKPRPGQMQDKAKKPKRLTHPSIAKPERRQREPKSKPKENSRRKKGRMDTDDFDKMVASHKKKLMSSSLSI